MRRPAPPLYRLSRAFTRAAIVALVLIIVFVATVVYSAAQIRPQFHSSGTSAVGFSNDNSVVVSEGFNLSNPGYYAISPLTVRTWVFDPSHQLLASGGSPVLSVGPGSVTEVPVTIVLPFSAPGVQGLLTHDASLPAIADLNATYAYLFSLAVQVRSNLSWGAPFYALNTTFGTPALQGNGSAALPVTVTFDNHADFAVVGTLHYIVSSAAGASCSSGDWAVDVPGHSPYARNATIYNAPGCDPSGGTVTVSYLAPGVDVPVYAAGVP